jgi:hypothetical protein
MESCSQVTTLCPVTATIYGHTPSLPTNATLLSIFSLVAAVQLMQGMAWRTWGFMTAMVFGSLCEIAGVYIFCSKSTHQSTYNGDRIFWETYFAFKSVEF